MKQVICYLLLLFFLNGCSQISQSEIQQPTQDLKAIETITPLPTQALVPVTTQPSPIAPKDLVIATVQAFNPSCDHPAYYFIELSHDISPDKSWIIINCEGMQPITLIMNIEQNLFWSIQSYEYTGDTDGIMLHGYRWTQDGNYLYLKPYFCCSDGPTLYNGWGLIKLDLKTGEYKAILQPSFSDTAYSFSISPDDRFLVYVTSHQDQLVHILDLTNGNEWSIKFKEKYTDIGDFVWTPDSSEILIVAGLDGWRERKGGYSVFLYNLEQDRVHVLIDNDMRQPSPPIYDYEIEGKSLWLTDETIVVYTLDGQFILNIRTNELSPLNQFTPIP